MLTPDLALTVALGIVRTGWQCWIWQAMTPVLAVQFWGFYLEERARANGR